MNKLTSSEYSVDTVFSGYLASGLKEVKGLEDVKGLKEVKEDKPKTSKSRNRYDFVIKIDFKDERYEIDKTRKDYPIELSK